MCVWNVETPGEKEGALRIAKITYRNIEESVGRDARVKAANKLSKVQGKVTVDIKIGILVLFY